MEFFRLSHLPLPEPVPVKAAEENRPVTPATRDNNTNAFKDSRGHVIVIPLWNIEMPHGYQN